MPGLVGASRVIDNTLSVLALIGVSYDSEVPLDEAFAQLDQQLAPLPQGLRENAATIAALIPEADGLYRESVTMTEQIDDIDRQVIPSELRPGPEGAPSEQRTLDATRSRRSGGLAAAPAGNVGRYRRFRDMHPQSKKTPRPATSPSRIPDLSADLAFAGRAALYLDKHGLDHQAVVQCLIEEFELDRETAEAVALLAATEPPSYVGSPPPSGAASRAS